MALYLDAVRPAAIALIALREQMLDDLDNDYGGIRWWRDHLDTGRRILIGDYLMSLTDSAESNLVEAAMHAHRVKEHWHADTMWMRGRLRDARETGQPMSWWRAERDLNRLVETDGHLGGFFRAIGSTLDNTAGLVIGVAGLRVNLVRCDLRDLRLDKTAPRGTLPEDHPGRAEQLAVTRVVRDAAAAGPRDWTGWVDDMRNTLVHRARRLSLALHDKASQDVMRPLPRHPAQAETEAIARSPKFLADRLHEHANDTIAGVLAATHDVVAATAAALVQLWQHRRDDPDIIVQPAQQWPMLKQGTERNFPGFAADRMPDYGTSGFLTLNPAQGRRLRGALLLGQTGPLEPPTWLDDDQLP